VSTTVEVLCEVRVKVDVDVPGDDEEARWAVQNALGHTGVVVEEIIDADLAGAGGS
jgi:hypothetical protein